MKGSAKLFIASLIVLACSLGFFGGAVVFGCNKAPMSCPKGFMPPPPPGGPHFDGKGPQFDGKGPHGPKRDHKKGPGFGPDMMDSVLQVTPEQKEALKAQREEMDAGFKTLREQKMAGEKELREALENGDDAKIAAAKGKVLAAQEALLNHRIDGVKKMSKILNKEQMEKFSNFQKEMGKLHKRGPGGPMHGPMHGPKHGPKGGFGPEGPVPPEAPEAE